MNKIILILITLVVLYKIFSYPKIITLLLGIQINRLRPKITSYLFGQQKKWQDTLKRFLENDKAIRIIYADEALINQTIENIQKDLDMDNKYQLLRQKFIKKSGSSAMLAHNYLKFLECVDYFRKIENIDRSNNGVDNFTLNVGDKKQRIYQIFEELLNA